MLHITRDKTKTMKTEKEIKIEKYKKSQTTATNLFTFTSNILKNLPIPGSVIMTYKVRKSICDHHLPHKSHPMEVLKILNWQRQTN